MSVHKGRNGGWDTRWDEPRSEGEKRRQRSRNFDRKADAVAFDAEIRRRKALGPLALQQLTRRDVVTLDEWIERRWAPQHAATLEPATRDRYASSYKLHVYPWLGDVPLVDLTVAKLREWQAAGLTAGASPETVIKARVMLSSVLTHAAQSEAISGNPLSLVKPPKSTHRDASSRCRQSASSLFERRWPHRCRLPCLKGSGWDAGESNTTCPTGAARKSAPAMP